MRHAIRMLIGCVLPLLLIFVLPLFGIGEGFTLFIAIVLMFGCHLMMIRGHHHGGELGHEGHASPDRARPKGDS